SLPSTGNTAGIDGVAQDVLSKVPDTPSATVEQGVKSAIARNLIASKFTEKLPEWMKLYADLSQREAMKEGSSSIARDILDASGVPSSKHDALLQAYLAGGTNDEILQRLLSDKQFTDQETASVEATLMLNDFTFGNGPLLLDLKQGVKDSSGVRNLGRMSHQD